MKIKKHTLGLTLEKIIDDRDVMRIELDRMTKYIDASAIKINELISENRRLNERIEVLEDKVIFKK